MQRTSLWLMLVVVLLGLLFLREPRLQRSEEIFLRWLLKNAQPRDTTPPLTIVEIGREPIPPKEGPAADPMERLSQGAASPNSPLDAALVRPAGLKSKP